MAEKVWNVRTGELENCNVGSNCQRHFHSTNNLSDSTIISVANSLEEPVKNNSITISIFARFKSLFSKRNSSDKAVELAMENARQKLLERALSIVGKTGHELDLLGTFSSTAGDNASNKGHLGNVIQENVFGMPANSTPEPDFADEGLELKVIGVKKKLDGNWVAKDRMVANIIDFDTEDTSGDIRNSSFWKKNQRTLVIMYESIHKDKLSNKIVGAFILDLNNHESFDQLSDDYKVINGKIKNGFAHQISGADTTFLEACTKGSGHGRGFRTQANSSIPAKQRAYAFKPRFISPIINKVLQERN